MLVSLLEIKRRDLIEVEVPADATILELKRAVSADHGFALAGMRIIVTRGGRPSFCPDAATIPSLGITDTDVLKLYAQGVAMAGPMAPLPRFELAPLPRRPRSHTLTRKILAHYPQMWTPHKWREMLAHSRHPLTPEDSLLLSVITAGNPVLYTFVLESGAPFWTYGNRAENLVTVLQSMTAAAFWPHFMVEHMSIFQELLLASIESRADACREAR
jgi:hypothetical protein